MNSSAAERHDLRLGVVAIVLPAEGDVGAWSRLISGSWRWRRDGCSGRDRPAPARGRRRAAWHRRPIRAWRSWRGGGERRRLARPRPASSPKKPRIAGFEGSPQLVEEQPAEEPREHADRQEEAGPAGDPSRAIERQSAARHDAMDVRMMVQVLAPGVEHGEEADLGAEMLGIGGDGAQRLGCRPEQDGVDRLLVLEGDLGDRGRQREHDVEVRHRQQLGLPRRQPVGAGQALALRAMPVAARVVGERIEPAVGAALDMAAERRRPASSMALITRRSTRPRWPSALRR